MRTFATLLAAAACAGAYAACPNQCSGHGVCTDNDVCACYRQKGTTWKQRVGWTGPDCSLRTCPLGTAYDMISDKTGQDVVDVRFDKGFKEDGSAQADGVAVLDVRVPKYKLSETKTFQVRVLEMPTNQLAFQWKYDTDAAFTAPEYFDTDKAGDSVLTDCSADKPCQLTKGAMETGVYIVFNDATATNFKWGNTYTFTYDYMEGRPYYSGNADAAHQQVECSGRGSCDRGTGRCTCVEGYSGEACQRTTCANDCSGHGVCQSLKRFVSDAGATAYAGYDAEKEMGCLCDVGFRGPDCGQIECPSTDDVMGGNGGSDGMDCSGRGTCDYSSGLCTCFKGYTGEACEFQTVFV
jgi:hypothetical protein